MPRPGRTVQHCLRAPREGPRGQQPRPPLASPLRYLQVTCGEVLLHVLLEGLLEKLLPLLQLRLLSVLHFQNLLGVLGIEFS